MTKKGLFITLMTVTFTFLRVSAFAEAPVISDPGDVIIGDLEQGGANNVFVFPDAIDLDSHVSDDTTGDPSIKWSYTTTPLDGKISINGVPAMDLAGGDDPTNPISTNRLDGNDNDTAVGPPQQDTAPRTITFRNTTLSDPTVGGGLGPYAEPATTGILGSETRMITLFASDCSTYSSFSITVYTANETSDSISGGAAGLTPVLDDDFATDPSRIAGWFGGVVGGTCTTGTATGLCMWVAANNTTTAAVGWISPPNFAAYPAPAYIDLVDLNVYRIRLSMYTDQTATGAIPFWTFGYNNLNGQTPAGSGPGGNTYGGDLWALDVAGGANGINGPANGRPNGRPFLDYWFCPNAVLTAQWRGTLTGALASENSESAFAAAYDAVNDINLVLRILDGAQGANSIHNEVDTGTICCKELRVDRVAIPDLAGRTSVAYGSPISTTLYAINPDTFSSGGNGTATIDNTTNTATFLMGPNYNGGTAAALAGGRKALIFFDGTQVVGADFNKALYPIFWQDNQLLQIAAGIRSGVTAGAGAGGEGIDPVDTVFINFDTPTSEIGGFNFTQRSAAGNMGRAASPRLAANTGGSSQIYTSFFFSQNATDIDLTIPGFENANRIRGYVDFINNNALGTNSDGRDPHVVDSMVLNLIDTSGFN